MDAPVIRHAVPLVLKNIGRPTAHLIFLPAAARTRAYFAPPLVLVEHTSPAPSARKLRARLDDLIAAANLGYVQKLPGRFHGLSGRRTGQFALDLHGGCRLVIEPANAPLPSRPDGTLDFSRETTIEVVYVGDYHDRDSN
jgi:toxin HigB-1